VHPGKPIVRQSYLTSSGQSSINDTASNYNDAHIPSARQADGGDYFKIIKRTVPEVANRPISERRRAASMWRGSTANAHAGAIGAMRVADFRSSRVRDRSCGSVPDDRAAWRNASRVINTGRAGGSVGLRILDGEQPQNQQAKSNVFHRKSPQFVNWLK
jgi:hypothetical protein